MTPITIFFCYAREDEPWRKELEKQLKILKHQNLIDMWHDQEISPGAEWQRAIDRHLDTAQMILLLISPDFMNSDYCYGTEMKRAMVRHERGEACVIPILLRPVHWQSAPFGKLQSLPDEARYIVSPDWHSLDEAFFTVAEAIREKVISLHIQQAKQLGEIYAVAGEHEKALAIYEEMLLIAPDNADLVNLKGGALYDLERYQEALAVFDHLVSLVPKAAHAFNNRGITLAHLGRDVSALSAFNKAILLEPEKLETYINKITFLLGRWRKRYADVLDTFACAFDIDSSVVLPPSVYVEWAQQLLEKPELAFLEVDTTGLDDDDEIIRILLLDRDGKLLFDTFVCGDKEISEKVSMITGISDEQLEDAPSLVDAWKDIRQAFRGKYILSFNLDFDVSMLEAAAKRYGLEMFRIWGECLMKRAMIYSRSYSYAKLSDLCAYIGRPLPDYPFRTAFHRAEGQIAVLEAILQNRTLEDPYEEVTEEF